MDTPTISGDRRDQSALYWKVLAEGGRLLKWRVGRLRHISVASPNSDLDRCKDIQDVRRIDDVQIDTEAANRPYDVRFDSCSLRRTHTMSLTGGTD